MKGTDHMPMLRLIPADGASSDEPLRFPTEAVRLINEARSAKAKQSEGESNPPHGSARDVLDALNDLTRQVNALTEELDVLAHLGGEDDDDDDRPRAA